MRILWCVGCLGYAIHIVATIDHPMVGIPDNFWVPFSLIAAAAYVVAGIRALFVKTVPSFF